MHIMARFPRMDGERRQRLLIPALPENKHALCFAARVGYIEVPLDFSIGRDKQLEFRCRLVLAARHVLKGKDVHFFAVIRETVALLERVLESDVLVARLFSRPQPVKGRQSLLVLCGDNIVRH